MVNIQRPKSLWPVQDIHHSLLLPVEEVTKRMADPTSRLQNWYKHYKLTPLENGEYSFEIKVDKSHVVAFGKIVPTGLTSCRVLAEVGMEWKPFLKEIATASVFSLVAIGLLLLLSKSSFDIGIVVKTSAFLVIWSFSIGFLADLGRIRNLSQKLDNI